MAPKDEPNKAKDKEKDELITAVYKTNLHCLQCARDIKRPLLCTQGIQNVEVNMEKGEITAKGSFDPTKVQKRIEKLSKKKIQLISPTVQIKDKITEKKVVKEIPKPAISRTTSVKVHMHCDQCERDLKNKLLMQKGIHNVKSDMKAQTLTVDGTIEPEKLVSFLRKKVKYAEIVAPKSQEKKEEKKEKIIAKEEIKKESEKSVIDKNLTVKTVETDKEEMKIVEVKPKEGNNNISPYFIHYVYAPQLFSDENPNACIIS